MKQGIKWLLVVVLGVIFLYRPPAAWANDLWVDPNQGSDSNSGSANEPLATIQTAINQAYAGDTVHLKPGDYYQDVVTVRPGQADKPITILGEAGTIVRGQSKNRVIQVFHSYIHLQNFEVNGQHSQVDAMSSYRDKLIYVHGGQRTLGVAEAPGPGEYLTGLLISHMKLINAGGECLRLRYYIANSEVSDSDFENCGVYDFVYNDGGKNGEAIYVGTSSNQWADGKNPEPGPDKSQHIIIKNNTMNTQGNECLEFKEGTFDNIAEYNSCTGNLDPNASGMGSRGQNIIRYNQIFGNVGAGLRLGGHEAGGVIYGNNNQVYGNRFYQNQAGGIKIMGSPQQICGNDFTDQSRVLTGTYSGDFDLAQVTQACDGLIATPLPSPSASASPAPTASPSPTPAVSPSPSPSADPSSSPHPSTSPSSCLGDINQDLVVDLRDYSLLVRDLSSSSPQNQRTDLNGDGRVNLLDYSLQVQHLMRGC